MAGNRKDRSRSPTRSATVGRRRENRSQEDCSSDVSNNMLNQMMMANMYPQGNMMMAGGMYPNMLMSNAMMGAGMMPTTGMEMMPTTGMEMIPQTTMDISAMSGQTATGTVDMSMMSGMMMDPSMMGMYAMGGDIQGVAERKEISLKYCKLTPPTPGSQEPPRRPKPLGCRTIFVGGLPDRTKENCVREIFERYGRIHILRLSTKNFCHIRFERESGVDAAMLLSGYHIKLIEKDTDSDKEKEEDNSKGSSSWLHVDYASSRDDQNEYERRRRQALRVQEEQMQQLTAQQQALVARNTTQPYREKKKRSPSPTRLQPFSNAAIIQLVEKIKSEDHFADTLPTFISWLERGMCSKKTATQFYTMLQATNSHIRRLFNEKMQAEEELQECKERVKENIEKVIEQLEQVAKVFTSAAHQRVWDHFTKPQRKNIETWQKMTQEFSSLKEEFNEKFQNEDQDFNGYNSNISNYPAANDAETQELKRENDSLRFQLEAYKNEVDVIKADAQKEMEKFKAQFIARQALDGVTKNPPLPAPVAKPPPPPPLPEDLDAKVHLKEAVEAGFGEAKLIGVMSAFLQVHPQGASLDYVVSYVRALFNHVSQATVHHVLQKHPDVFQLKTTGIGANIENRWSFVAFVGPDVKIS